MLPVLSMHTVYEVRLDRGSSPLRKVVVACVGERSSEKWDLNFLHLGHCYSIWGTATAQIYPSDSTATLEFFHLR